MKRFIAVTGALSLLVCLPSCGDKTFEPDTPLAPALDVVGDATAYPDNPVGAVAAEATVPLMSTARAVLLNVDPEGTIDPASLYAVLPPGGSITEHKDVYLPPGILPEMADIMFSFDLTGSMSGAVGNAKVNSNNIMTTLAGAIDDAQFGVMSHMDYPDFNPAGYCGYGSTYGSSYSGDYAYMLDEGLTSTIGDVSSAISGLTLGYGVDAPEDYTRVLWEAYNDPNVLWRTDAARFLVYWLDNQPHDCSLHTGPDPGPDGIAGNADDLFLATTLQGLADAGVTLVVMHNGGFQAQWDTWAQVTGGNSFQINYDGSIPGGVDIADFILQKIQEVSQDIDVLELRTSAGFEGWAASDPIYDVDLAVTNDFDFDVDFTVPGDALPGIYDFDVCVFADGAPMNVCQDVQIVVYDPTAGFVTGGGWIDSPAGAYVPDDLLFGKASFGFVAKYKKGAQTPDGNTEFQFKAGDLNFHSSSYQWLVVSQGGANAQFKGSGTINGSGDYLFMIWAGDGDPDTFRIKIWTEDAFGIETVVYDNGVQQAIGGGSIVIHTK